MTRGNESESFPDGNDPSIAREVYGPCLERLRAEGGIERLGLPLSDVRPVTFEPVKPYCDQEIAFQRGTIYANSETGEADTFGWYAYEPLPGVPTRRSV